eukprot:gene14130-biopygen3573
MSLDGTAFSWGWCLASHSNNRCHHLRALPTPIQAPPPRPRIHSHPRRWPLAGSFADLPCNRVSWPRTWARERCAKGLFLPAAGPGRNGWGRVQDASVSPNSIVRDASGTRPRPFLPGSAGQFHTVAQSPALWGGGTLLQDRG